MPIVTCPTCRARYDAGVEDDLVGMPDNVSLKVVCPACGQWVQLPEREPVDPPDAPRDILDQMKSQSRLVDEPDERPRRPVDEDDEEGPRRRRRRDEDDDDFNRPRRRRRWADQERDDFDDDPRGPRPGDGLGMASMVVGICSAALGLLGVCCILFGGLGLVGGIVAVVLGFMARGQNPASGQAKAGIITGFVGIGLSVALVVLSLILGFGRALLR
jgi:hypothetical protein